MGAREDFLEAYADFWRRREEVEARRPRVLLVGETNPYSARPDDALLPYPANSAGGRLMKIFGLDYLGYLLRFERANLCRGKWDKGQARIEAVRLRTRAEASTEANPTVFVLLGTKVCEVFGYPSDPFALLTPNVESLKWVKFVVLPHPSGRCRVWNDHPDATGEARSIFALAGVKLERGAL